MKLIKEFPASEPLVAMIQYKDTVLVCSSRSLYRLAGDKMEQIEFVIKDEPEEQNVQGSAD